MKALSERDICTQFITPAVAAAGWDTELLALCDPLKSRVAAARAKHAQLAEALVEAAVA